ncbi:WbqC family protein [Magnetococcales bacterium HHB-1]
MTVLAVLQPGYLPWLGYFDQLARADFFIHYDDVQFDKHGWRNRNRIKGPDGPQWLTVPVHHKGRHGQKILDVEINNQIKWGQKHSRSLELCYSKAPFRDTYLPQIKEILQHPWKQLIDLDLTLIEALAQFLNINTPTYRASELNISGSQSERLLKICQHFGVTTYLSGDSAKNYLDLALFASHQIEVVWQSYQHPEYTQQFGAFHAHLSVVDLLFNEGPESQKRFID